ncbi:FAD-dependent oxidoreductase [Leifsonia shinshuensis]
MSATHRKVNMPTRDLHADLLIVGGGLGGVAAALTAAGMGSRVIITEESPWLGGQVSSQAVPPDEHEWIETSRISPNYSRFRNRIRDHYRTLYPLSPEARAETHLNPGAGFVSRLCHEPRVAALVISEMLSPLIASGLLTVLPSHRPVGVEREGGRVRSVTVSDVRTGELVQLRGELVIDATELGDLLELGAIDHVIGAEASTETGELHAPATADPLDQQAVTWCAAVEYRHGEDHTIPEPAEYAHWKSTVAPFWPGSQLSWEDVEPITLAPRVRPLFDGDPRRAELTHDRDLWHYRRVLARRNFEPQWAAGDVTLINWPQIDYWEKPLVGVTDDERRQALDGARGLTLSFIHWMQTEAPRSDGGFGYPELKPRGDITGTDDGLAQAVYVRESRRIRALFTVTEEHIGREMRGEGAGSAVFDDSVGIGYYRIDLHPSTSGRTYVDIDCFPFQIPLGALIPAGIDNLIAGNKNIGTTHITNGAYRLHPVEWSIGEAAGALAVYCAARRISPEAVRNTPVRLSEFQRLLSDRLGIALAWPEIIRTGGSQNTDIQLASF